MTKFRFFMLFALSVSGGAGITRAQEATLSHLWATVKAQHPALQAASAARQAAEAGFKQSGTWENPELQLEAENVGGDRSGTDEAEWTVSLAQQIEWPGRRSRKKQAAQLELAQAELEQKAALRDLAIHLAGEFYQALALQESVLLELEAVEQAEAFVEMAGRRVELGSSTVLEVNKAKLELAARELDLQRREQLAINAARHLGRMVGQPVEMVVGEWRNAPAAPDEEAVRAALQQTAAYARPATAVSLRKLEARDAASSWLPDLVVAGGVRQNDAEEVQSYLGTVGFVLPLWNRGGRAKTAAKARLLRAESERELADRAFAGEVARLTSNLQLLWQEQARYGGTLIPLLEQHAEQAEESYREGFVGYLEYLDARAALRAGQLAYIEALKEYHVAYQAVYSLVEMDAEKEIENEK